MSFSNISWHEEAYNLHKQGLSFGDISNQLGVSYGACKSAIYRYEKRVNNGSSVRNINNTTNSTRIDMDGTRTYNLEKEIINGEEITPEIIMKAKNLKPEEWEVVTFNTNVWQGQNKNGKIVDMCQSKLIVRPKRQSELSLKDIEDWFEKKKFKPYPIKVKPFEYNINGEILEIDIADLHCGLLSWVCETGSNYDLKICADRFLSALRDVVNKSKNRKFKKIYFCTLGDILHIDNDKNTTTSGTFQDTEGRLTKIFDSAYDILQTGVDMLLELGCPIEYVYTCGNHDRNTGYFLVKCLKIHYELNENITFNIEPNPQKAIHFGNVLIGLDHGDISKKNFGTWLMKDYRKWFGESKFIEEHSGHIHTEEAKVYNGILVRSILALCGNSYWEHQQGYRSERGLMSFVWNEETGLRESWYYYL